MAANKQSTHTQSQAGTALSHFGKTATCLCRDILNNRFQVLPNLTIMTCCISSYYFFLQQLCAPCTQRVPTHVPAWR